MRIKKICLDLDDVCNAFTLQALKHVGCDIDVNDFSAYKPEWGFDIIRAANELLPFMNFTKKSFWERFYWKDWTDFPKSKEFDFLLETSISLVGQENVLILTNPICGPEVNDFSTMECLKESISG
ncbi:hypothetical protein LCGC14_1276590 [marine sediment metagenome]|uniref:Uncharacterized protein n=1 Tax=marine sediment metagenome TaxID=412755 RepID=A0A0F9NZI6_9ZZZZ